MGLFQVLCFELSKTPGPQRRPRGASALAGASVCGPQVAAASVDCACGIRPGSAASAFITIRPVEVGESMISRSAAVTSSSSGKSSLIRSMKTGSVDHEAALRLIHSGKTFSGRPVWCSWALYGLGTVNQNRFDPNSISNPFGRYGSPLSPDSIHNPMGRYGSPLSPDSVHNPYGR